MITPLLKGMTTKAMHANGQEENGNLKSTSTSSPATGDTYWLLQIPATQETGIYNGTNTIEAVTGEGDEW